MVCWTPHGVGGQCVILREYTVDPQYQYYTPSMIQAVDVLCIVQL